MNLYLFTKILHLFFVIAWMAVVFCLPRMLLVLAEPKEEAAVRDRLVSLGCRTYKLGHFLFGMAFFFGMVLWLHFGISGPWLHVKLLLVALLLVHFILSGRWLKGVAAGRALPSAQTVRWFNYAPSFLLLAVVWLVLGKPI